MTAECPHVRDLAGERRSRGGQAGCKKRAPAFALAAFKVAVAGAMTAYWPGSSWSPFMAMHIEQPGFAPLGPGFLEDPIQPFGFGLLLDLLRAGHDQHAHAFGDFATFQQRGGQAQIARCASWCTSR